MEVSAKDIIDSVDLNRNEALLPIYESVVNSIISLNKTANENKEIKVIIERQDFDGVEIDLFGKISAPIKNVKIIDNGEGFTEENFTSFKKPFSKYNKKYGCKGVGRFTILALFRKMEIKSIYKENGQWKKRIFSFDAENEIYDVNNELLSGTHNYMTEVDLIDCSNKQLVPYTKKNAEEIAKGIMEHCFIYYLSGALPEIQVCEKYPDESLHSVSVNNYFSLEAKEKEKTIEIKGQSFKLYVVRTNQITSRKYNYVSLCANSRKVGNKRDLAKTDSLYAYPITENGESKYLDVYVVSTYLDSNVNNQRTGFKFPETIDDEIAYDIQSDIISMEEILQKVASEVASLYEYFAQETKKRNIKETIEYIDTKAPQYHSFKYRQDVLEAMPPNLTEEKKDEYLHRVAYQENKKIEEKIEKFIQTKEVNEEHINSIIDSIKKRTAYNTDTLAEYVFRRKAILRLFGKMLDKTDQGTYELESMIHNLVFPMGLTNRELVYQYHNLWLLDDRFSTYRFIASDKSITSYSQIKSSKEPDLILINNEKNLIDNPISFGNKDEGRVNSMVIFEFKRPGDTAHQKNKNDYRWEFSDLVKEYFEIFQFGNEKQKKNYRGNVIEITSDTPKFGYVIMDEMPDKLVEYNKLNGWRLSPFGSYYKIIPEQNLHIEAITFQNLLVNARERNNPFFDQLFAVNNENY